MKTLERSGFAGAPSSLTAERKANPTRWIAALGAAFLVMAVYVMAAWVISGDATPTHTGVDAVPTATKVWAWMYQSIGVTLLVGCLVYVVRQSRREGRLSFDAILFIAWTSAIWLDPATNNYLRPNMLYNSYLINFGSWAPHIPGWLSPNANLLPEPIVAYAGLYGVPGLLVAMYGCTVMRWTKRRWPATGRLGLFLSAFAAIAAFDLVLEVVLIRTEMWAYPGSIQWLSIWGGERYQFPLYEPILFGAVWAGTAALRYFRDDRGRSVVERGVQEERVPKRRASALRVLAVTGFVHAIYLVYAMVFSWLPVYGGPYPEGYNSYMLNGMCGPGTQYVCPGPKVPIPLPDSGPLPPPPR